MLRPLALAATLTGAAAFLPGNAAAQSFVPQPQLYLLTTDVFDGRALWVQPAGLAKRRESSIAAMLSAQHDSGGSALGQYGLTLASNGAAFGWQHDRLAGGGATDAFVLGYGAGSPVVSLGVDKRWHRGGGTRAGAWDVGGRYLPSRRLELSLVWRDLGSPVVAGDTIRATLVPGFALRLLGGRARVGADWEIVTDGWGTSALRTGAALTLPLGLVATLRSEFDSHLAARSVAVGLTWSGRTARVTGFGVSARGAGPDRAGLWASAVAEPPPVRRRFGR